MSTVVIGKVVTLSVLDLFAVAPMLLRIIMKGVPWLHSSVVSDIPGNPHAFDDSVISLFRTLPELSNFNIVWTNLPLDQPLRLQVNKCACINGNLNISCAGKNTSSKNELFVDLRP